MNPTTTILHATRTVDFKGDQASRCPTELYGRYQTLIDGERLSWTGHLRLRQLLGSGGQGVVYLSDRRGCDGFTIPVALKFFSPERYESQQTYDLAMRRIGTVACKVAQIQHDGLLDVHNFIERDRIRIMEMEWVDGYDLDRLLSPAILSRVLKQAKPQRREYIKNVIATVGPKHSRLKPGIAVAIIRQCLAALASLHRDNIIHGDIKPANIMVKRTGTAKLVDIGSAIDLGDMPDQKTCTPKYAAPEMLDRNEFTTRSDLASLGYVLVEALSGAPLFAGINTLSELLEAKWTLPQQLERIVPVEVSKSELLMTICKRLVAPDPVLRFSSADDANTGSEGLAEFQRSLVIGDLASEYDNELRIWLEELD